MENTADQQTMEPTEMSWDELRKDIARTYALAKETSRQFEETKKFAFETFARKAEADKRLDEMFQRQKEEYQRQKEEYQRWEEERKQREFRYEEERKARELRYAEEKKAMEKRMEKDNRELNKKIRELDTRFLSQSGHIVEGLMEPSAMKIFKKSGFDIDKCWKEMKGKNKAINREMEVDLFYHDTTESVAVEVKIKCNKSDIDHFIEQMGYFKQIFPEFAKSKVYLAIAAVNYDRGADKYAAQRGLFIIRVNDDNFTLDPADKKTRISV